MSGPITLEQLKNASLDAQALAEFMQADSTKTVHRRIASSIRPLQYYLEYLESIRNIATQQQGFVSIDGVEVKTVSQAVNDAINAASLSNGVITDSLITANSQLYGAVPRTQAQKNKSWLTAEDFGASDNTLNALLNLDRQIAIGTKVKTDDAGIVEIVSSDVNALQKKANKIKKYNTSAITVSVGHGGDFGTINDALNYLDGMERSYHHTASAKITLLAGFVISEQVLVYSRDLSWIEITSEDDVVGVKHTAITNKLKPIDGIAPIFGGANNATLPIISIKMQYANNTTSGDGIAVYGNSTVLITPGCGVINAKNGLTVYNGSRAVCDIDGLRSSGGGATAQQGVIFTGAKARALDVQQGSFVSLPRSNLNDCKGDVACYVIWGCYANLYQSQARNAAGTAFLARDGSVLCIRECDMDNAGNRAVHALHGAIVDARAKEDAASGYGLNAAKNCRGSIAVLASAGATIEAPELDVSGAAVRGFVSADASIINAYKAKANDCKTYGFMAERGSTIACAESEANRCGTGYHASNASTIDAHGAKASNCEYGVYATRMSNINVEGGIFNNCGRSVQSMTASKINAKDTTCTNATSRAFSIIDGGVADINNANSTGATGFDLTLRGGGIVHALNYSGKIDLREGGGIVFNHGGTGTLSQAANINTNNGIIYR